MSVMTCGDGCSPRNRLAGAAGGARVLYRSNVNVLDESTLRDAMARPDKYPQPTARVSGYVVNNAEAHPRAVGGCARVSVPRGRVGGMRARRSTRKVKPHAGRVVCVYSTGGAHNTQSSVY